MKSPELLARRARRAYELGRLRMAVRRAWPVLPMIGVSVLLGASSELVCCAGAMLALVAVAGQFCGGAVARGVSAGLWAGMAPLALPLLIGMGGHHCGSCCVAPELPLCMAACIGGGAIAGVLVGVHAAQRQGRAWFAAAALLVAGLCGALGCALVGGAGFAGMSLGLALGSVPGLLMGARAGS